MGFFEDELQKVFGRGSCIRDARFAGRACIGRLGETTNVKVQFVAPDADDPEQYTAIQATVLNRNEGKIDEHAFLLDDLLGTKTTGKGFLVSPHISGYDHWLRWAGYEPTADERRTIAAAVNSYLEVFLDPPAKARVAEKTGGERADGYTSVKGIIEESKKQPRQPRKPRQTAARGAKKDERE